MSGAGMRPHNFKILVEERIHNPQLRNNLARATSTTLKKREEVVGEFSNWEEMREAAHEMKRLVIEHLDTYLRRFVERAETNGMIVHFANDGAEAGGIALDIIRRHGGKTVVKSKSMTTEEIHLNALLESNGIESLETDLGEYIVQLAGEIPSHITAPALHKSRQEIGALFAEKLGIEYTESPEELTAIARNILRKKFLDADIGISGVNAAVADTGTICVVENEGNARLSVSLPKVHIAVMGIEKIVPDTRGLALLLKMLARSSTGQRISSYTSFIAGPRRNGEIDGPEEVHLIILDNGRTRMLQDPRLREALYCIRCGACLNVCPVYQTIGGHSYGTHYPGPIGSVITPVFEGLDESRYLPFASSLCGNCSEICPVKIPLHHLLLYQRQRIVESRLNNRWEKALFRCWLVAMRSPGLYAFAGSMGRVFSALFRKSDGSIPVPVWSKTRSFPAMPDKSFRTMWKEHARKG